MRVDRVDRSRIIPPDGRFSPIIVTGRVINNENVSR